jgi:hypothetical protein
VGDSDEIQGREELMTSTFGLRQRQQIKQQQVQQQLWLQRKQCQQQQQEFHLADHFLEDDLSPSYFAYPEGMDIDCGMDEPFAVRKPFW